MASLNINKLINYGLLITIFSQIISYLDNSIISFGKFDLFLKLLRVIPFIFIIFIFFYRYKLNLSLLVISFIFLFVAISSFLILYKCCYVQYFAGLINLIALFSFLVIIINPFSQIRYKQIPNLFLRLIQFFFFGNILLQLIQSFSSGSPGYALRISLGPVGLWIRSLGFFDIPSTSAVASLSLLCVISKEIISRDIKIQKLKFTILYFLPCLASIFLAGSGTAILGIFIYIFYARNLIILDPFPNLHIIRKIFRSSFLINISLILLPLITIFYFSLPYILGREDILTSFIGRINIFRNIPDELSSLLIPLKNFGLYTNLFESFGNSFYTNISDSTITSLYVQYGFFTSLVIYFLISSIFIKSILKRSAYKINYPLYIMPFLPIFITSNIFEGYFSLYSLMICYLPFKDK